jgi:short-subunit dehydrogenase
VAAAKTIVVTGASSGIGREIAIQLAAPTVELWLVGRNGDRLNEVATRVRNKGAVAHIVEMDLADQDVPQRFLDENFPSGKPVDEVYLAAAITQFGEVKDTLVHDWQLIYQTNLLSPVQWILHFYRNMVTRKSGRIVIISSLAAYTGYPTATAYATMKAGLLGLYRSLLHEGKPHNVDVCIASPGYVDTNIYKSAIFRRTSYEKTMSQIKSMGFKVLLPEEAAGIILRRVRSGKREFALPSYASLMKWVSPRFPLLVQLVHNRIVKSFRQSS